MSGSLSGVAGRNPVHVRTIDSARERRHERAPRGRACAAARARLMRRVPPHQLARRADEHLPRRARLHVERDRLGRHHVRAREVAELHELVAAEAGIAVGDREVPLARHDRQLGREAAPPRRPPRSRRRRRAASRPPQRTRVGGDRVHAAPLAHRRRRRRAPRRAGAARRAAGRRTASPGTSRPPASPGAGSARARASSRGVEHLARDAGAAYTALLRRARRRSAPRPPRPRSCRTRRTPRPRGQRRGASSRQSRAESAVSASCSGESSIATRCPMPAAVVPPAGERRVEHEHAPPVARQLPRARGADDPGADDDRVVRAGTVARVDHRFHRFHRLHCPSRSGICVIREICG